MIFRVSTICFNHPRQCRISSIHNTSHYFSIFLATHKVQQTETAFGRTCLALKVPPNSAGSASDSIPQECNQDEQSQNLGRSPMTWRLFHTFFWGISSQWPSGLEQSIQRLPIRLQERRRQRQNFKGWASTG